MDGVRRGAVRVALGAALVALVGFLATRPIGAPGGGVAGGVAAAERSERSAGFVPTGGSADPLAVGSIAPELVGESDATIGATALDGRPLRLADLRGRPAWLVFWATWCPPCREEFPLIATAAASHEAVTAGLQVIPISTGEPAADVRAYAASVGVPGVVGLDPTGLVADRYRVVGLPSHYFIGPNGAIVARYFGPMTADTMAARLEGLLAARD